MRCILALTALIVPRTSNGQDVPAPDQQVEPAQAEPAKERMRLTDPEDGWFDVSEFLEHPAGFMPLVVPITEPAVGYGAVGAAVFLDPRESAGADGWARPNITAVGGLATENGSDGFFAGNSSMWSGGDLQTLVGVGSLSLDLGLYGVGSEPLLDGRSLDYDLDVDGVVGEVRTRLGESDFWGGLRAVYADATVGFESSDRRGGRRAAGPRRHARRPRPDVALRHARQRVHAHARLAE